MNSRIALPRWLLGAAAAAVAWGTASARAEWLRSEHSLGWGVGDTAIWRFSFDPAKGKTFFHPLSLDGVTSLTEFQPKDHPWHYGLWLSWKYINGVNYWEEDRTTGRAEGATRWTTPRIETRSDGRATIRYELTYTHPSGRIDLREARELVVSALQPQGFYSIEWTSRFTAGEAGAVLDRTPMPAEPKGQVNGGYGGLGLRLVSAPASVSFVSTSGDVTGFAHERARPASPALACNVTVDGQAVGSLAIFSDPANAGERAPWYIVNGDMRFVSAAVLAPKPRTLPAGSEWTLRYRIVVAPWAWTAEWLKAAAAGARRP